MEDDRLSSPCQGACHHRIISDDRGGSSVVGRTVDAPHSEEIAPSIWRATPATDSWSVPTFPHCWQGLTPTVAPSISSTSPRAPPVRVLVPRYRSITDFGDAPSGLNSAHSSMAAVRIPSNIASSRFSEAPSCATTTPSRRSDSDNVLPATGPLLELAAGDRVAYCRNGAAEPLGGHEHNWSMLGMPGSDTSNILNGISGTLRVLCRM
jgi:hypothetical protein